MLRTVQFRRCIGVREMIVQMKGVEKRLDDIDRMVEATIKVRIMEEIEKLRAEFRRPSS